MATRVNNSVTLNHADAIRVAELLSEYADGQNRHARRTRSAPVRDACYRTAVEAREYANSITRNLWTWEDRNDAE